MKHLSRAFLSTASALTLTACGAAGGDAATSAQSIIEPGLTRIAAGYGHTCAIRADRTVACWGNNSYVLGAGNHPNATGVIGAPQAVPGLTDVVRIASGYMTTLALHADGRVSCWGNDASGQCGAGAAGLRWTPVAVAGVTDAVDVAVGTYHACVVHATGAVSCVGYNSHGQLGDGTTASRTARAFVTNTFGQATRVFAGAQHTCVLNTEGELYCFGRNDDGQAGSAGAPGSFGVPTPARVTLPGAVVAVTMGYSHTCAVLAEGAVYCWGSNYYGQRGVGVSAPSLATPAWQPSAVPITDAVATAGGGYGQHACVVRATGAVACWGFNSYGQLGDGTGAAGLKRTSPVAMIDVGDAAEVSLGGYHTCVRRNDGTVACAGGNVNGQLGNGVAGLAPNPVAVTVPGLDLDP